MRKNHLYGSVNRYRDVHVCRNNANHMKSNYRREMKTENECEHRPMNGIENAPALAMVFSPIQEWREIYDLSVALERGTLFKELDKPLEAAGKCSGGGRCGC